MAFDSDERLIRAALDAMESGLPVFDPVPGARARAGLRKRRRKLRMAVAAAAAAACLITGCAAALGAFDWLSDILPRSFVGVMEPVESTVSDEGIEFTVIGAQRFDGMAALYYSVRDVSGEGRISKNVSVPVSVRGEPRPEIMDNKLAYFDEASGAAVFELTLDEAEGCDELTVGAGVIGTRRVDIESSRVDAALDELLAAGGEVEGDELMPPLAEPVEAAEGYVLIDSAGIRDGKVSVQLIQDEWRLDLLNLWNLPELWLKLADGSFVKGSINGGMAVTGSRAQPQSAGEIASYIMFCGFDVTPGEAEGAELYAGGRFTDSVSGSWSVTFDISNAPEQPRYTVDIPAGGGVVRDVEVAITPVGASITGEDPENLLGGSPGLRELYLLDGDGEKFSFIRLGADFYAEGGPFEISGSFASPVDAQDITALMFRGERIELG